MHLILPLLCCLALTTPLNASEGDRQTDYIECTTKCTMLGCLPPPHAISSKGTIDGSSTNSGTDCALVCDGQFSKKKAGVMRVWTWSCKQECGYQCMWQIQRRQSRVLKYHGKWPFVRLFGMQEAASVLLSVCNLLAHVVGFWRLSAVYRRLYYVYRIKQQRIGILSGGNVVPLPVSHVPSHTGSCGTGMQETGSKPGGIVGKSSGDGLPKSAKRRGVLSRLLGTAVMPWTHTTPIGSITGLMVMWTIVFCINMLTWIASAVFHTQDVRWTERTDYFWADMSVLANAATALLRVTHPTPLLLAFGILFSSTVAMWHHWHYMTHILFDYGYNVLLCILLGISTAFLWLFWLFRNGHPARMQAALFFVCVFASMSLEVLDFPPLWWIVDAHALWHAATVPLTVLWYQFLGHDMIWATQVAEMHAARQYRIE